MSHREARDLIRRARAAYNMGRPKTAIELAIQAAGKAPEDSWVLNHLAWLHLETGQYEDGAHVAERSISRDPENEWPHRVRGLCLWETGREDEALESLKRAMHLDPSEPRAFWVFAWRASTLGRGEEAYTAAKRGLELAPDMSQTWFALGWASWAMHRWNEAENALKTARNLTPGQSAPHNNLGALYAHLGRYDEALELFGRALQLDARSRYAYVNSARCLRELGRWNEAFELIQRHRLNRLFELEERVARAPRAANYASLAGIKGALGRLEDARNDLRSALELADGVGRQRPLAMLAEVQLRLGRSTESREAAEELVRAPAITADGVWTASVIGWLLGESGLASAAVHRGEDARLNPVLMNGARCAGALAAGNWSDAVGAADRSDELRFTQFCCSHAMRAVAQSHLGLDPSAEVARAVMIDPNCESLWGARERGLLHVDDLLPPGSEPWVFDRPRRES